MKLYFYFLLLLICSLFSCEDKGFGDFGGESTFIRFYGTDKTDLINEVVELADSSGYAFIGITNAKILDDNREFNTDPSNINLTITDRFGSTLNSYNYAYSDFGLDTVDLEAFSMKQTVNGDFIIGGSQINIKDSNTRMFLMKVGTSGLNPQIKFVNEPNANTVGREVTLADDGGFALIGSIIKDSEISGTDARLSDFYAIRTGSDIDSMWAYPYGSDKRKNDVGVSIVEAEGDGFVWLGTAQFERENANTQIRVAGISTGGVPLWDFMYGGEGIEAAWSIQAIPEGYIIAGSSNSVGTNGKVDIYLIKINNSGTLIADAHIGTSEDDIGLSIKQTSDNGFIITGTSNVNGNTDIYLAKVDLLLNLEWDNTFGGEGDDSGFSVIQTADGGYLIGGMTQLETITMMSLIKTDSKGRVTEQ